TLFRSHAAIPAFLDDVHAGARQGADSHGLHPVRRTGRHGLAERNVPALAGRAAAPQRALGNAAVPSFDIVSQVDRQEVKNAVDQANKEVANRFDFKGSDARIELAELVLTVFGDDEFKLGQVLDV